MRPVLHDILSSRVRAAGIAVKLGVTVDTLDQDEDGAIEKVDPEPGGSSSSSGRAATPRAGALLVEVYGRVVGKQSSSFSPNTVLLEFTKYLVSIFVFE